MIDPIHLAEIQSGDVLAWSRDPYSTYHDMVLRGIEAFTNSKYGHVGVAWRLHDGLDDELFVIEATMPKIRIARAQTDRDFFCVQTNVIWTNKNKSFLLSKLDYPYGLLDAVRGGLGYRVKRDMQYQCAELVHGFLEASGILLKPEFTPGQLIANLEAHSKKKARKVIGPGRTIDY